MLTILIKKIYAIFSTIVVNIFLFLLLTSVFLLLIGVEARFSNRASYSHIQKNDSINSCLNSPHIQLSREQASLLHKSTTELTSYCQSRTEIKQDWIDERTYWDYHYYSQKKLQTPEINFNDTDLFNSRAVPCSATDSIKSENATIWIFGGSTMQNMETSDQNSIANVFCEKYSQGKRIKVLNLGVGSFYSELEIAKLLNLYKLELRNDKSLPSVAIFYNGYNDSQRLMNGGSWAGLPPGVSNRLASAYSNQSSFSRSFYWFLRSFNEKFMDFSQGKKNFVSHGLNVIIRKIENQSSTNYRVGEAADWHAESDGILLTSKAYIHDQRILAGICKSLTISCFTVLQPMLALRENPIGEVEKENYLTQEKSGINDVTKRFYREVKIGLKVLENQNYHLIDLSNLPNNSEYSKLPFFYDFGHTGYYSGIIIGSALSEKVANFSKIH